MEDRISLVMIVKNEEKNLPRCLKSVKGIVDEMIIVDTGSDDGTKKVAYDLGAKVYDFKWINDFSAARNFGLDKATSEFRIILDADEYIVSGNKENILNTVNKNSIGQIEFLNAFQKNGEVRYSRNYISRICYNDVRYTGKIHEQLESKKIRVKTNIQVSHDGYLNKDKSQRNLDILFDAIKDNPNDTYLLYQLAHTLNLAGRKEESAKWYEKYYRIGNLRDYYRCEAVVDYLYNLIAIGKLEEGLLIVQNESIRYNDSPDFNFVCGEFYRELVLSDINKYINYLPYIEKSYFRCLEIGETQKYDSIVGTGSFLASYNLGVWYEVSGQVEKAKSYYTMSVEWGYQKAAERLKMLNS